MDIVYFFPVTEEHIRAVLACLFWDKLKVPSKTTMVNEHPLATSVT